MGKLTNLNPPGPIADADIPDSLARDTEYQLADAAHIAATDPHLQYPTQARGDARYVRKFSQSFKAAPNVSQNCTVNIPTKVSFNTVITNIGNQFSNSRLTALESEIWQFYSYITFEVTGRIILNLYKNGGPLTRIRDLTATGNFSGQLVATPPISLAVGDYLELFVTIFSTNSKIYADNSLDSSCWEGYRVG